MLQRRLFGLLALLSFLVGPLGFLALEHGAFHRTSCDLAHFDPSEGNASASDASGGDASGGGASRGRCPVCHFLTTTSVEAPAPAVRLPALVPLDDPAAAPETPLHGRPASTTLRSRAPPFLLS